MLHKAWNSKEEMPYCFPRSSIKFQGHTGQNITDFDPNWAFPDYRPVAAFKSLRFALFKVIRQISRSHGSKNRQSQTCLFYQNLGLIIHLHQFVYIQWDHRQWVLHIPHGTAHIRIPLCTRTVLHHGPWNSLVLYLGWTVGVQWAVYSAIGTGFYKLLSVLVKSYTRHMP